MRGNQQAASTLANDSQIAGATIAAALENLRFDAAITDYGAVDGEDAIDAFREAYDAIPATGGRIIVPAGNWGMSEDFLVDKPKVMVVGGHGSRIFKIGTDHHLFDFTNNAVWGGVMGCEIDGVQLAQGSLILCRGSKNVFFDNYLHHNGLMSDGNYANGSHGICLDGQTSTCSQNLVLANRIETCHDIGVSEHTAPDNRIYQNQIIGMGFEGVTIDVTSHRARVCDNLITGSCIRGGVGGIGVDGSDLWLIQGNQITGTQSNLSGIKTQNDTGPSNFGSILGNLLLDNGLWGLFLFHGSSGNSSNHSVLGNVVRGNTAGSIRLDANCDNNIVVGNQVNGSAVSNAGTGNSLANNI